jgi:hypothetical protein
MATRSIVPRDDNEGGIGTALKKWATGFIKLLTVDSVNKVVITAPATSAILTIADGKTLSYSENTWVPELKFGGANVDMTYSTHNGNYTKIGNTMIAWCELILTAKGSSSGIATITLPVIATSVSVVLVYLLAVSFASAFQGYVDSGNTHINLQQVTEAGGVLNLTNANFTDTSRVYFTIIYK